MLFCYPTYYPYGGMNDFNKSFDTLEESIAAAKTEDYNTNWHVFDSMTREMVASSDSIDPFLLLKL